MIDPQHMKSLIISVPLLMSFDLAVRAQEEAASPAAEEKSYPEVPKEYEVGQSTVSSDGRFAILYPVRHENSNENSMRPNLLVRLKPYAVLKEIETDERCYVEGWPRRSGRKMERQRLRGCVASQEMGRRRSGCLSMRTTKSTAKRRSGRRW